MAFYIEIGGKEFRIGIGKYKDCVFYGYRWWEHLLGLAKLDSYLRMRRMNNIKGFGSPSAHALSRKAARKSR